MHLTWGETKLTVDREPEDLRSFRGGSWGDGESQFLAHLKRAIEAEEAMLAPANPTYSLIKKRMHKDGHMVDERQQYLRTAKMHKGQPYVMIYNDHWALRSLADDWREDGRAVLAVVRGVYGQDPPELTRTAFQA